MSIRPGYFKRALRSSALEAVMESRNTISENSKLEVTLGTYGHEDHRSITISHGSLQHAATLTFERTLRVPDNHDVNNLPPSLWSIPAVLGCRVQVPHARRYSKFGALEPFAMKIYVGGVNAVSGVPYCESAEARLKRLQISEVKQDYVVLQDQDWLDGIASEDGRIRQFVAMPKGSSYSVEAQVTGEEKIDGLQFEMIPVKRWCPKTIKVMIVGDAHDTTPKILNLHEKGLSDASTIWGLKKVIEKDYGVAPVNMRLGLESPCSTAPAQDINDNDKTFAEIWTTETDVVAVLDVTPRQQAASSESLGFQRARSYSISQFCTTEFIPFEQESLDRSFDRSSDADPIIGSYGPKVEALSLAAGGLIKQSLNVDKYPPSIWDKENTILFNVQLLNAESFFSVTGRPPPSSPVTAEEYAEYGYPFYDIWNEKIQAQ